MIQSAAPSMPDVDQPHKIPIIDVKLAHIVEDYIERVLEMPRTVDVRSASRELGAIANPGKGRRREVANLSEPVLHLLATRLLLRDATLTPDYRMIAATIGAIRAGSFTAAQLQVAAREVRALGAPSANRNWIPGTTTNGPLWCLCGHVLARLSHRREGGF